MGKDFPFHFSRRMRAVGESESADDGSLETLGPGALALLLILVLLLPPLPQQPAMVVLLTLLAFLASLTTLLVNGLVTGRTRPAPRSVGVGDFSIETATSAEA